VRSRGDPACIPAIPRDPKEASREKRASYPPHWKGRGGGEGGRRGTPVRGGLGERKGFGGCSGVVGGGRRGPNFGVGVDGTVGGANWHDEEREGYSCGSKKEGVDRGGSEGGAGTKARGRGRGICEGLMLNRK
jgi:hypothetical protein